MAVLVFSDLHGNISNILPVIQSGKFDKIIFAGDLFGYFPCSKEVIDLFHRPDFEYILGNHDLYYLRKLNPKAFEEKFSKYCALMRSDDDYKNRYGVIEETLRALSGLDLSFLFKADLRKKLVINKKDFLICHGSPYNPFNEYIYPDYEKFDCIYEDFDFDVLICGHTHKSNINQRGERYIINPGSCTLPRGGYDPSYISIEFNPLQIAVTELEQKIRYQAIGSRIVMKD